MSHGWPGSIFELLKVIEPLTDPTAHGGAAEDAFHLVIPSLPGYGFSARPEATGWDPDRIAYAWDELMGRLGYDHYVSQGGDWGAVVAEAMGRQAPAGLRGIHVNLAATVPPEVEAALAGIGPAPAEMSEQERAVFDALSAYRKSGELGLFRDADRAAAGHRVRPDGLPGRSRGVHPPASRVRAVVVRRRSRKVADERRRAGRHHAVLADEHRDLVGAAVLGARWRKPYECDRDEDR
jgi:pimeloyl-ACP methyl ester carboxylesterase